LLNMKRHLLFALIAWIFVSVAPTDAIAVPTPQTTSFTYQGQLNAGGILPSGQIFQFTFTLYDALTGGNVVGTPVAQAILVGNGGLFTADLDFGPIFNGTQYWLEIKVGTTVANEQALASRQRINVAPVAQYALNSPAGDFADFFALMPPDNAATVAPGADVQFPQNGPASLTAITRTGPSTFNLSAIGTYQVTFQVSVNEPGQLVLAANGIELAYTVVGRQSGTTQIVGTTLITTTVADTVVSLRNPAAGIIALTVTPAAGGFGLSPVSAHLVITRLR
jgi:hypothetical protein